MLQAQGVPLVVLTQATSSVLDGLAIDADAKARITTAGRRGDMVIVPAQDVPVIGGQSHDGVVPDGPGDR